MADIVPTLSAIAAAAPAQPPSFFMARRQLEQFTRITNELKAASEYTMEQHFAKLFWRGELREDAWPMNVTKVTGQRDASLPLEPSRESIPHTSLDREDD